MHRSVAALALVVGIALAALLPIADAKPSVVPHFLVGDLNPAPLTAPVEAISLWGELWANGENIGAYDFALLFDVNAAGRTEAELWLVFDGAPHRTCRGEIFSTPADEPIFFGNIGSEGEHGTCHMARSGRAISLFVATDDGQWATALLSGAAAGIDVAPLF